MNTKEAIQAMLYGKKVRVNDWDKVSYAIFDELTSNFILRIEDEDGYIAFNFCGYGDCIWEIYEEQKPVQTVTIEKWLCIEDGENYCIYEGDANYFNAIEIFATKKVKLLDTYEVTL